ncbi:MAG: glycosyltransferase family 9 protein [Burkholderiales bacterium]
MNISLQRLIDRYAGIPLCALVSVVDRWLVQPLRRTVPRAAPMVPQRILVILLSEMGSLVLAQPMFAALRARYPGASLHVMLFGKNREVLDLLGVVPPENVIAIDDRSLGPFIRSMLGAMRAARALAADVVIDCELFARVSSLLAYLSGATLRVGFHRHTQEGLYRGSFINRPVPYNPYLHLSRQFLALAGAIDSQASPLSKAIDTSGRIEVPPLQFAPGEVRRVWENLERDYPTIAGRRLALLYPSGGFLPIRAWPLDSYRTLAANLLDEGYAVGIIGLASDQELAAGLVAQLNRPHGVNLAGYTRTVRHLLAVFADAALLVTNDGGPGQFAALTSIPTIVMFGPETPLLYGSNSRDAFFFHEALPCSPCLTAYNHRTSPCDGDNQCLKRISPQAVLAKSREFLALGRGRGHEREHHSGAAGAAHDLR